MGGLSQRWRFMLFRPAILTTPPHGCPHSQETPGNDGKDEEASLYILLTPERDAHKNTVRAGDCMVAYAKKAAQHNLNIMLHQGCHTEYKGGAKCFAIYPFQSDVQKFASHCPLLEVEDATLQTIKFTATVEDAFAEPGGGAAMPQDKWIHIIAYASSGWQHMHLKPGNVADAMREQGFVVMRSNRQYNTISDEKVKADATKDSSYHLHVCPNVFLTSPRRPSGQST